MSNRPALTAALLAFSRLASCGAPSPESTRLQIEVAPLSLPGVDRACFDLAVSAPAGLVWRRGDPTRTRAGLDQSDRSSPATVDTTTLCSDAFGNGEGGDLTYVGPCDATSDSDPNRPGFQNDVTLHIDGLYAGDDDLGDWRDPCPDGCTLSATCAANSDTLVTFDLTVMRDARQGFVDIAVDLEDVFCSAKLDTCYEGDAPIRLLHGADEGRDWTAVFGFACTGGVGSNAELYLGAATVTCGAQVFELDPRATGNQSVTASGDTLHYGVYRGEEALLCDGSSCEKLYWNLALSLDDLASFGGDCTFEVAATVAPPGVLVGGVLATDHTAYPFLEVSTALTDDGAAFCQRHGLDDGGALQTHYRGDLVGLGDAAVMCSMFDGTTVAATAGEGCPGAPCPAPNGPFVVEVAAVDQSGASITGIGGEVQGPDLEWVSGPLSLPASFAANTGTTLTLASRFGGLERQVTLEVRPRQLVRIDVLTGAITTECAETARVLFVHTPVEVVMDARSFEDEALPAIPLVGFTEATPARCLDLHGTNTWRPVPFSVWRAPGATLSVWCHWGFPNAFEGGLAAQGTLVVTPSTTTSIDPRIQVLEASPESFPPSALGVVATPGTTRIVTRFEPITVVLIPEDLAGQALPSEGESNGTGQIFDHYSATPGPRTNLSPANPWTLQVPQPDGGIVWFEANWGGLQFYRLNQRLWKNRHATYYAYAPTGTDTPSTPGDLNDPVRSVTVRVRFQPIEVSFYAVDGLGAPSAVPFELFYNDLPAPVPFVPTPATYPHRARGGQTAFRYRVGEVDTTLSINPIDVDTTYTNLTPALTFSSTPTPGVTEVFFVF